MCVCHRLREHVLTAAIVLCRFYALECEPIGVEMTMHQLTVDRERRGSFFGPVRRPTHVHKAIMESMREEVGKGNVATLDFAKRVKAGPGADATEEELMAGGDPAAGSKSPEPTLYHKAMLPALSTDPDDETYRVRSMGTPTRRGTRGHARESLEQLMKTGVNPDNMQRYLAIVEQRCMEVRDKKTQEGDGAVVETSVSFTWVFFGSCVLCFRFWDKSGAKRKRQGPAPTRRCLPPAKGLPCWRLPWKTLMPSTSRTGPPKITPPTSTKRSSP